MKFKDIILDPNLLWKRETERFVELLSPRFGGYNIEIKAHELSKNPDYVEIRNVSDKKLYCICFKVYGNEEGIRLQFNTFPKKGTPEYKKLTAIEYESLGYGTNLEIEKFDLASLDDSYILIQFIEFLENGTVPDLK